MVDEVSWFDDDGGAGEESRRKKRKREPFNIELWIKIWIELWLAPFGGSMATSVCFGFCHLPGELLCHRIVRKLARQIKIARLLMKNPFSKCAMFSFYTLVLLFDTMSYLQA